MKRLDLWKDASRVGWLSKGRSGLRFEYSLDFIESHGLGLPTVSTSLPTSLRPYNDRAARPFFDALLPEGEARRIIAYDASIPEGDTFDLLELLGRDCAGALCAIPEADSPPESLPVTSLTPLAVSEIDGLISQLRFQPLGIDGNLRVSLGGVQEKLLLTRGADCWALPTAEVASTHILKPAIANIEDNVANEAICLKFAQLLGVPAANVSVDTFGGRPTLIVERFDRQIDAATGKVVRFHQETAYQALAVSSGATTRKYEDAGGPSLSNVAKILRRWSDSTQVEAMLKQVIVNVLVGNADYHAMNVSFLLGDNGAVAVAPMYDSFSTLFSPQLSTTPGMFIGGSQDLRSIGRSELAAEAISWGIQPPRANEVVDELLSSAVDALDTVLQVHDVPDSLAQFLRRRVAAVVSGKLRN